MPYAEIETDADLRVAASAANGSATNGNATKETISKGNATPDENSLWNRIQAGTSCFVIAEAGVNHNGDLDMARRLIDAAQNAGADAVKFQTWITDLLVTPEAPLADYQRENSQADESQYAMLKRLELSHGQFEKLKAHAMQQGMLFLSTPDEERSADFLEQLDVPLFKIGSGEVTNLPLLRHVGAKGRPILLSTGMSTLGEVERAVRVVEAAGCDRLALLHCVSDYPALPADCNLRAMDTLRHAFARPVGFSDHTEGVEVALAAVARGACILEKHFTLDKTLPGPDHRASLDVAELTGLVRGVRAVESALGDGIKRPTPAEFETRRVVRRSLVLARPVQAGEPLRAEDLLLRRAPGQLTVEDMPLVINRRAARSLPAHCALTLEMLH